MRQPQRHTGFSLTEVLLAVATLAVGMLFVGGTFVLGIFYSARATEQTIAAVVVEEAVTKIRLYGFAPEPNSIGYTLYGPHQAGMDPDEFLYPSGRGMGRSERQYSWSALCKRQGADPNSRMVQVTVFVSRSAGIGDRPVPTSLQIKGIAGDTRDEIQFSNAASVDLLYEGSVLVDDITGQIYRVLEIGPSGSDRVVRLDRPWQGTSATAVWAVPRPPSPTASTRNPCIAVYQTEMRMPRGPEIRPNP